MGYLPDVEKVALAFQGGERTDGGQPVRFSVVEAGSLVVTTGEIAASDPFTARTRRRSGRRLIARRTSPPAAPLRPWWQLWRRR